jgi:hypothetical protein
MATLGFLSCFLDMTQEVDKGPQNFVFLFRLQLYLIRRIQLLFHAGFLTKAMIQANQSASVAVSIAFDIVAHKVINGGILVHMRELIVVPTLHFH